VTKATKQQARGASSDAPTARQGPVMSIVQPWSYQAGGKRGDTVTAWERPEKGGVVYLRWTDPAKGTYAKLATGIRLRDRDGALVKARIAEATRLADEKLKDVRVLRAGASRAPQGSTDGRGTTVVQASPPASDPPVGDPAPRSAGLPLRAGITEAMQIGKGVFARATDHARDTRRALDRVLAVMDDALTFEAMKPQHYRELWRGLATQYKVERDQIEERRREALAAGSVPPAGLRPTGGRRATHMAVIALVRVARWLEEAGKVSSPATRPPHNWRKQCDADWQSTTGEASTDEDDRPRYTPAELGRLHLALERADPRLRLAVELAGEARLGPVVKRCRRSDLSLDAGAGALGLGQLRVSGAGTKPGVKIDFDATQRALVDATLAEGYLRDLERLYRDGVVSNYWLWPAGRLRDGRARTHVTKHMDDRTLNDLWRALERLAGVPHKPGRGAYGMRRISTDLAEDLEPDERALDGLFGHTPQGMRRGKYQNKERVETALKTTAVRRRLREHGIEMARRATPARPHTAVQGDGRGPALAS
jgi:hypothetical protein